MISVFFGLGAVLLGGWGLTLWRADFFHFLKGLLPVSLLFSGIIAVWAGISGKKGHDKG